MQHLAIIPDGNRRWAKKNKLKTILGHETGVKALQATIKACIKKEVKYLSLYTFSLENFRRSEEEKSYLFTLLKNLFIKELPALVKNGIRVRFLGDNSFFPKNIQEEIIQTEEKTKKCTKLNLNLLFCYGAQQEIVNATKKLAQQVKDGKLAIDDISEKHFDDALWTAGIPHPDLILRTSGITRLSNFLMYQAAYSEFLFLDEFWPEMTEQRIEQCIDKFQEIQRNFGT